MFTQDVCGFFRKQGIGYDKGGKSWHCCLLSRSTVGALHSIRHCTISKRNWKSRGATEWGIQRRRHSSVERGAARPPCSTPWIRVRPLEPVCGHSSSLLIRGFL